MSESVPPLDDELSGLLEDVANRELTGEKRKRLEQRLAEDPGARAVFIRATALDAMLSHEFPPHESDVASSALELPETSRPERRDLGSPRSIARSKLVILLCASLAASILLVAVLWPAVLWPSRGPYPVARIASSENAAWESALPTIPGSELVPGLLKLRSGIAVIQFSSGAEVTLEAPAQIEVLSPMRGKLVDGAAVIHVPEQAIGFVMETPRGFAVDYGTTFAVQVDKTSNQSEFELIEGEIAVHHAKSGEEIRLTEPHDVASIRSDSVAIIDPEQPPPSVNEESSIIRIGTEGRATSVIRNNKRKKFLDPEILAVKTTENGKWEYRSFFSFDLSSVKSNRINEARLRLNLVPSRRGFASRLPVVNRFGIYGLTNPDKADWAIDSTWEDAPAPGDGVLLGTFEVLRSEQRGTFGIANDNLEEFLRKRSGQKVTLILVRETGQVEGQGPGLTHMFASDAHPEAVGPLLELLVE